MRDARMGPPLDVPPDFEVKETIRFACLRNGLHGGLPKNKSDVWPLRHTRKRAKTVQKSQPETRANAGMSTHKQRTQQPLLVIDGDSFAHRSYHALPKSIQRRGGKGGGAIV